MKKLILLYLLSQIFLTATQAWAECGPEMNCLIGNTDGMNLILDDNISTPIALVRKYESGSDLFNFFFWPSNLEGDALEKMQKDVYELQNEIDEKYKEIEPISFKKSNIVKKINELEEEKDRKISELFKKYGCTKNQTGDSCTESQSEKQVFPESCKELGDIPWNNNPLKDECLYEEASINSKFEETSSPFEQQIMDFESEIENQLVDLTAKADAITALLENNNENSEEWVNQMQTKEANIFFVNELPQINFKIIFNNNLEGVPNRFLYYKSKDQADIADLRYFSVNQTNYLEFTLFEKRATRMNGVNGEERTGNSYKVKLIQTELDFGLQYQGDVERFNASGKNFGKGKMKIYIKPKY